MRNGLSFDLRNFVELTDRGKRYVEQLPITSNQTPDPQ
jgi:hypothetical protein